MTTAQRKDFEELEDLQSQVRQAKQDLLSFPRGINLPLIIDQESLDVTLWLDEWTRVNKSNVELRVCSLSTRTKNKTIANVFMGEGGFIETHSHDRREVIHVMDGEYVDPVTRRTYRAGDRQIVAPYQEHGIRSDYVLLSITWEPAYPEVGCS